MSNEENKTDEKVEPIVVVVTDEQKTDLMSELAKKARANDNHIETADILSLVDDVKRKTSIFESDELSLEDAKWLEQRETYLLEYARNLWMQSMSSLDKMDENVEKFVQYFKETMHRLSESNDEATAREELRYFVESMRGGHLY